MMISGVRLPDEQIKQFCERHKVRELSLFGSIVKTGLRAGSDVDVLVAFKPDAKVGFLELSRMQRELTALIGHQVDLVPKDGLKASIRDEALASAMVIHAQ